MIMMMNNGKMRGEEKKEMWLGLLEIGGKVIELTQLQVGRSIFFDPPLKWCFGDVGVEDLSSSCAISSSLQHPPLMLMV